MQKIGPPRPTWPTRILRYVRRREVGCFLARVVDAAGEGNKSDKTRVLFYVTFKHPNSDGEALGNEAARSLRPSYRGKLKLGQIRRLVTKPEFGLSAVY